MAEITKNSLQLTKEKSELKKELAQAKKDYADLESKLASVELDRDKLEQYINKLQKGALAYTINDGYISNAVLIPNDFETTYPQDIPKEINTTLYQKYPFYKMEEGIIVKDEEQYKKYKGAILL